MRISQAPRDTSRCPNILDIRVDDPIVIEELASRDTLEAKRDYGEELLELGARVARTQRPVTAADRLKETFQTFQEQTEKRYETWSDRLEDQVESTQRSTAQVTERTERVLRNVMERLEQNVGLAEGTSQRLALSFKERLETTLTGLGAQVDRAEQVIAAGLQREQALLAQQNLREQASRKGTEFEELVKTDLQRFGRGRGDLVELTGTKTSSGGSSKKGDLFYQMKVGDRVIPIVIECKDKQLSLTGTNPFRLTELEEAMNERGGQYGIVVANLAQNVDDEGPRFPVLQCFGEDRFVVLVDREQEHPVALETVLHLIHRRESETKSNSSSDLDIAAVSHAIEKLQIASQQFRGLKSTCTNLGTQLAKMRQQLDDLDGSIDDQTEELKALLGLAA